MEFELTEIESADSKLLEKKSQYNGNLILIELAVEGGGVRVRSDKIWKF